MKIVIKKEKLLYDISNLAYVIADGAEPKHKVHIVADIAMEGNIDRVARLLGLAFARVQDALKKILVVPESERIKDISALPRDYVFELRKDCSGKIIVPFSSAVLLKETIHEYMVCFVLADWLGFIFPQEAGIWRSKAEECLAALSAFPRGQTAVTRRIPPI